MTTPMAVLNARERLVKSIAAACVRFQVPYNIPFLEMIATDLFGDTAPDITPPDGTLPTHIGPVAELAMWFALYCEEWGIMQPNATMPSGIMINPILLVPLLCLYPMTFAEDLYHEFEVALDDGKVICKHCNEMVVEHYEGLEKLHMAKIESLRSEIDIMEATADIQRQAIVKQTEAIEALTAAGLSQPSPDINPDDLGDVGE